MSKGPGRIMRSIIEAIGAEPKRRFTYDELAANAYGGEPITHSRRVAVRRAVQALVSAKLVSLGTDTVHWLRTVRAYDPDPLNVASVQASS
jgi:hypothetical protein